MRKIRLKFLLTMLFCSTLFSVCFAADTDVSPEPEPIGREPVVCTGDSVEYLEQGQVVIGHGNVVVTYQDTKLTCDLVQVNLKTKDAQAQGNVKLFRSGGVLEAEVMNYNFGTKYGDSPDLYMTMAPWYGLTKQATKIDEKQLKLNKAYITSCDKDFPHYRIQGRKVYIYLGDKVVIYDAVWYIGRVPVMYLPYYSYSLKDDRMHVMVTGGKSREWGHFVLTAWKYKIDDYVAGRILVDERELKGYAWGVNGTYNTQKLELGQGEFRTYYVPQRDKSSIDLVETERYRGRVVHKWQIDEKNSFLGEAHKWSDPTIVKDYFWREYDQDTVPDSYASLVHSEDEYSLNFLVRKRVNRFFSETQRIPELNLTVNEQQIGDTPFYYKGSEKATVFSVVSGNTTVDEYTNRFYSNHEISYPTKLPPKTGLGWLNFTPYTGTNQIYYSRTLGADERDKIIGQNYSGWDMQTRFYRIYGLNSRFLGVEINDLRHVVTPDVKYTYRHRPTTPPGRVGTFEGDNTAPAKFYTFSLENRLQTKQYHDKTNNPPDKGNPFYVPKENRLIQIDQYYGKTNDLPDKVDLLYISNTVDYLVHYDSETRGSLTDIISQLDLYPYRYLTLYSDSKIDPYQRTFTEGNVGLVYNKDKWLVSAESRWTKSAGGQVSYEAQYNFNRFWQFRAYSQYDRLQRSFLENEYSVYRDLHCWLFEWTVNKQKKRGNTVWFIFRLKVFPKETPFELRKGYHQERRSRLQREKEQGGSN